MSYTLITKKCTAFKKGLKKKCLCLLTFFHHQLIIILFLQCVCKSTFFAPFYWRRHKINILDEIFNKNVQRLRLLHSTVYVMTYRTLDEKHKHLVLERRPATLPNKHATRDISCQILIRMLRFLQRVITNCFFLQPHESLTRAKGWLSDIAVSSWESMNGSALAQCVP